MKAIAQKSVKLVFSLGMGLLVLVGFTTAETAKLETEEIIEKLELFVERNPIPSVHAVYEFVTELIEAPDSARGARDGTFRAESVYDDYGYKHVIALEIKDERIVSVRYDEQKKDGHGKRSDEKYCREMKEGSGASPAEVYPQYEQALIRLQDLDEIDGVSGATYSLYRFKTTAVRALRKATK